MTIEFNDILLYTYANGKVKIEVIFEEETFWLSQSGRVGTLFFPPKTTTTHCIF